MSIGHQCSIVDCSAWSSINYGRCLEHLEFEELSNELAHSRKSGRLIGRGVHFTRELVERIDKCAPPDRTVRRPSRGRYFMDGVAAPDGARSWCPDFSHATFSDALSFVGTTFGPGTNFRGTNLGRVPFHDAKFSENVSFREAVFEQAMFDRASFGNNANFSKASFGKSASFSSAKFSGTSSMTAVRFDDSAVFNDARFGGEVHFSGAVFGNGLSFKSTRFGGPASFSDARIGDDADFSSAVFESTCRFLSVNFGNRAIFKDITFPKNVAFSRSKFGEHSEFGPLQAAGFVNLQGCCFAGGSIINVQCSGLQVMNAIFPDGILIRIAEADVDCSRVNFGSPSIITTRKPSDRYVPVAGGVQHNQRTPRLVSLKGAQVGNLRLNGIDMRPCFFAWAHNLETLRIEGPLPFAGPPSQLWWSHRRIIAEEHWWRASYERKRGRQEWSPDECRPLGQLRPVSKVSQRRSAAARASAEGISATYRSLRKALEDEKNEPGAADFYYGEMEMRRQAKPWGSERALLTAYWLISGYGLRASRALFALALVIVLSTAGFATVGFGRTTFTYSRLLSLHSTLTIVPEQSEGARPGWSQAFSYGVTNVSSFLTPQQNEPLTIYGRIIDFVLRILGPTCIGLAAFAFRGRLKR